MSQLHWVDTRRDTRLVQYLSRAQENIEPKTCLPTAISRQNLYKQNITANKLFLSLFHFSQVSSGFRSLVSSCTSGFWLWASCWCVSNRFASVPRGNWTPSRLTPLLRCAPSSQVNVQHGAINICCTKGTWSKLYQLWVTQGKFLDWRLEIDLFMRCPSFWSYILNKSVVALL